MEDHLSSQEFQLSQLEEQFYIQSNSTEPLDAKTHSDGIVANPTFGIAPIATKYHESNSEDITDIQYHPLVTAYLSKQGDLDLLYERLDDLVDEKQSLEAEKQSRLRFGLTLDPDDQKWLDGSAHEYDALMGAIKGLEREVEDMKQECLSRGLVDEDGEPTTFRDQEEGSFKGEDEMHPGSQTSEYVKYPLLIPHPGVDQDQLDNYDPKPDDKSDITTTRINEWMLKRLRTSPLDVNLLASTFEGSIGKTDDAWQFSVLSFWFNDGTVKGSGEFPVHTGSLTTEGGPVSEKPEYFPNDPIFERYYDGFRGPPLPPQSNSSTDTEIAIMKKESPGSPRKGLFWNSD